MKIAKVRVLSFLAGMAMVVLAGVSFPSVAHAQLEMGMKIPFDFYVGAQKYEAGKYSVQVNNSLIKLTDEKGHSVFAMTNPVAIPSWRNTRTGLLVFNRYDDQYFLSEVQRPGYSVGNELIISPMETQIAKNSSDKDKIAFNIGK